MWNCLKTGEIPKLAFFSKPLTNEINTEKNKEVKFTVLDGAVIQILRRRQIQSEVQHGAQDTQLQMIWILSVRYYGVWDFYDGE